MKHSLELDFISLLLIILLCSVVFAHRGSRISASMVFLQLLPGDEHSHHYNRELQVDITGSPLSHLGFDYRYGCTTGSKLMDATTVPCNSTSCLLLDKMPRLTRLMVASRMNEGTLESTNFE
jgi:hypothetical protein